MCAPSWRSWLPEALNTRTTQATGKAPALLGCRQLSPFLSPSPSTSDPQTERAFGLVLSLKSFLPPFANFAGAAMWNNPLFDSSEESALRGTAIKETKSRRMYVSLSSSMRFIPRVAAAWLMRSDGSGWYLMLKACWCLTGSGCYCGSRYYRMAI